MRFLGVSRDVQSSFGPDMLGPETDGGTLRIMYRSLHQKGPSLRIDTLLPADA